MPSLFDSISQWLASSLYPLNGYKNSKLLELEALAHKSPSQVLHIEDEYTKEYVISRNTELYNDPVHLPQELQGYVSASLSIELASIQSTEDCC